MRQLAAAAAAAAAAARVGAYHRPSSPGTAISGPPQRRQQQQHQQGQDKERSLRRKKKAWSKLKKVSRVELSCLDCQLLPFYSLLRNPDTAVSYARVGARSDIVPQEIISIFFATPPLLLIHARGRCDADSHTHSLMHPPTHVRCRIQRYSYKTHTQIIPQKNMKY